MLQADWRKVVAVAGGPSDRGNARQPAGRIENLVAPRAQMAMGQ